MGKPIIDREAADYALGRLRVDARGPDPALALRVDAFRPVDEFKATMDDLIRRLKAAPKAAGQGRIYIHGEKEFEAAAERQRNGVILHPAVVADLRGYADELGVPFRL